MVDITITGAAGSTYLSQGTTGDDAVTYEASVIGGPANANIGNGGSDTAVLSSDNLAALAAAGFDFGATTADTWTIAADDTFDVSFVSITTSDGYTLEAGSAWADANDTFDSSTITGPSAVDGSYAASVALNATTVDWDGSNLSSTSLSTWTLVEFDGNAASALATAPTSDGAGTITIDASGAIANFTPNTSALAGTYTIGDQIDFTYDMVLEDPANPGTTVTVPVTYTVIVGWTAGDDVADVSEATTGQTITDGAGFTTPDGVVIGAGSDAGDDLIQGSAFADVLAGGIGSDTIKGGDDADTITDTSLAASGDSNFLGGGAGNDTITAGADGDTLVGAGGDDSLNGGAGDDILNSGGGNDVINAGAGDNFLRSGDGDDTLNGGSGNDTLKSGDGDDVINAGAGTNTIYTSLGDDTINAGAGDDLIILKAGTGTTTVNGFDAGGSDQFDLNAIGWTTLAEVLENTYELDATNSVIVIDDETNVIIDTATLASLDATDFDFA